MDKSPKLPECIAFHPAAHTNSEEQPTSHPLSWWMGSFAGLLSFHCRGNQDSCPKIVPTVETAMPVSGQTGHSCFEGREIQL